jgi:hypothetical protein
MNYIDIDIDIDIEIDINIDIDITILKKSFRKQKKTRILRIQTGSYFMV